MNDSRSLVNCLWRSTECPSQRAVYLKCREPGYLGCYKKLSSSQVNTLSQSFPRHTVEHDLECVSMCREQRQVADVAVLHRGDCVCVPSNSFASISSSETNLHEWTCPDRDELEFKSDVCYAFNISYGFCEQLDSVEHGQWDSNITWFGSTVSLTCEEGYVINGSATLQCVTLPGQSTYFPVWNSSVPSCEEVETFEELCDHPGKISNGEWNFNVTSLGSSITLICDDGYVINGSATLQCVTSSDSNRPIWNTSVPTCQIVETASDGNTLRCSYPGNVSHGKWDSNITRIGSMITLDCDEGYALNGSATLLCVTPSYNGSSTHSPVWNSSTPSCLPDKTAETGSYPRVIFNTCGGDIMESTSQDQQSISDCYNMATEHDDWLDVHA
ncbi:C4b-binding protein alpha chain-like [Diadema setosum]|uniref:C4b-binding protein alpha chain-like n=1 Tax=Diadema setosum TaxID=31175 RepID=UPI003B3B99C1